MVPTAGTSEQGIKAGLGSASIPEPSLSHPAKALSEHISQPEGEATATQPGRVAPMGAKHGDTRAGAWDGLAGWSNERKEAPPLAVGVLLASAVSDLSPVGVCKGGSGTYTVSPSEWPPPPPPLWTSGGTQEQFVLEPKVTQFGSQRDGLWPHDKTTKGSNPSLPLTPRHQHNYAPHQGGQALTQVRSSWPEETAPCSQLVVPAEAWLS